MSNSEKVVFKDYNPKQLQLLPPSLDELIAEGHPVRVVDHIIDKLDIKALEAQYKGGGTSSYHPRLLLKVLVYGYLTNIYSSRKLEAAIKENIHFMWLSGMSRPDHNTLNRFRSDRLKGVLKEVFSQVVLMLHESGHLDMKNLFTDGTKMEANANKYTFVWANSIKWNKRRIVEQLEELWAYTQQVAKEELGEVEPNLSNLTPEKVQKTIDQLNEALKGKKVEQKVKAKLSRAKQWVAKVSDYQRQEEQLGGRNSYSKTDPDATFMRLKEDHMRNGQLKAAYNVQMSTNKQLIVHYTIHQTPSDTLSLTPHIESFKAQLGNTPDQLTADAGYGSEQNYAYLEKEGIAAFVKYNTFQKELKTSRKPLPVKDQFAYDRKEDVYYCPSGKPMKPIGQGKRITAAGYEQTYDRYEGEECQRCPLLEACHSGSGNRIKEYNPTLEDYRRKAKDRLCSKQGIELRKQRNTDVETVFGQIKANKGKRRFSLRGLDKVEIEFGLIALAHNIAKLAA